MGPCVAEDEHRTLRWWPWPRPTSSCSCTAAHHRCLQATPLQHTLPKHRYLLVLRQRLDSKSNRGACFKLGHPGSHPQRQHQRRTRCYGRVAVPRAADRGGRHTPLLMAKDTDCDETFAVRSSRTGPPRDSSPAPAPAPHPLLREGRCAARRRPWRAPHASACCQGICDAIQLQDFCRAQFKNRATQGATPRPSASAASAAAGGPLCRAPQTVEGATRLCLLPRN